MHVTADTITDEQILALRVNNGSYPSDLVHHAWAALGTGPLQGDGFERWRHIPKVAGRAMCAARWNEIWEFDLDDVKKRTHSWLRSSVGSTRQ